MIATRNVRTMNQTGNCVCITREASRLGMDVLEQSIMFNTQMSLSLRLKTSNTFYNVLLIYDKRFKTSY